MRRRSVRDGSGRLGRARGGDAVPGQLGGDLRSAVVDDSSALGEALDARAAAGDDVGHHDDDGHDQTPPQDVGDETEFKGEGEFSKRKYYARPGKWPVEIFKRR